ncbi:EAF domain-containing protein [Phanerochaete sordida]|uniref:EAF domain-containing protein n=1 Tax=Phanerochaete sordida TaxID=48140 RepID=A0A9P3L7B0_9APHY|nr:EAF domain-containing protein [Phanerochaete sordida]
MGERAAASWTPKQGRHSVTIGPSLQRTLKARKNEPPPNAKHERHYYAFRYGFLPESVDLAKPSTAQVRKGEANRKVDLQRGSVNNDDEVHLFDGTETTSKEWDCVLIYDEESKMFTLEKLDSTVQLTYDKKRSRSQLQTASPLPSSIPSTSASSPDSAPLAQSAPHRTKPKTAAEQLEAEFEGVPMNGSPRTSPPKNAAQEPMRKKPQKKDPRELMFRKKQPLTSAPVLPPRVDEGTESGEIVENSRRGTSARLSAAPASSAPSPSHTAAGPNRRSLADYKADRAIVPKPPTPPTHPLPAKPTGAASPPKSSTAPVQSPVPAPAKVTPKSAQNGPKPTLKKRERPDESSLPPSPPKRPKQSLSQARPQTQPKQPLPPPPKKEVELAFPGGGSNFALPSSSSAPSSKPPSSKPSGNKSAAASLSFPGSPGIAPSLPASQPAPALAAAADDSDEEEWDDVLPTAQAAPPPSTAPARMAAPAPPPPIVSRAITMEEIVPEPTVHRDEPDDEEEEIDEDIFAEQLKEQLGEDEEDDFLAAAISPFVESQPMPSEPRRPISMNQLASFDGEGDGDGDDSNMRGEDDIFGDDDDTSSSDDSDDD